MAKKKGSALLMILIALVVLSLIGTAVISYSVSNYKLRNKVSDNYEDRYIAEGGIDQAYGALVKLVSESTSQTNLKNKINSEFYNKSTKNGDYVYFDNLYDKDIDDPNDPQPHNLEINLSSQVKFENSVMEIEAISKYKGQQVIGKFEITDNSGVFTAVLKEKAFK